jgi:hypothetical protein
MLCKWELESTVNILPTRNNRESGFRYLAGIRDSSRIESAPSGRQVILYCFVMIVWVIVPCDLVGVGYAVVQLVEALC